MNTPVKKHHSVLVRFFIILAIVTGLYSCRAEDTCEILWDNYGVPHIYGQNESGMFYAFGWAQMTNHADLILKLYGQARGRASEFWGEEFVESDKLIRLFELRERANRFYKEQDKGFQECLDAFVKGMNDFALKNPGGIHEKFRQVLPITVDDVLSHVLRIMYLEFLAGEDIAASRNMQMAGSNALAIAPSKSLSGNSMLVINPHLPWYDYFLWFESHLNCPDYQFYGITLVGMPSPAMGFNNNLGWAHTINPLDASDRFEFSLQDDSYHMGDTILPLIRKTFSSKILQKDGTLVEKEFECWYSVHGPVIRRTDTKAVAVRIAGLENTGIMKQYFEMTRAGNFREFENALKSMQIPMFNIIYADKEGNIFYLFNGNIPVRKSGDFAFWKGIIDGNNPEYLWTGSHPYEDLPKLINPSTGFIQNCNDAPWSSTYPFQIQSKDFPSYFSAMTFSLRAQHATRLVKDDPAISFDELIAYKHNTEMEASVRFLDDLLKALSKSKDPDAKLAFSLLSEWDGKTDNESRGAVLFAEWWGKMNGGDVKQKWDPNDPLNTPAGIQNNEKAVKMMMEAVKALQQKYGSVDIAWGEVNRFRLNGIDLPGNGGPGDQFGLFRTNYFTDAGDGKRQAIAGETFIAVVEFGENPRAMLSLSYGNASQEGNLHKGDQLILLSEKKLRPALLEKPDINSQLEKQEILYPNKNLNVKK